jgi:hypothetical protein
MISQNMYGDNSDHKKITREGHKQTCKEIGAWQQRCEQHHGRIIRYREFVGTLSTIIPANEHGHPPYPVQVSSDSLQGSYLFIAIKGKGDTICFR